jgi:GTP-binding protein Era
MVGRKVAIVSDKPQTTRRAIRGVASTADTQLVLVDLPGVQRPRDALTERMQHRVESEMAESDAALFVINAEEGVGPGERFIAERCAAPACPWSSPSTRSTGWTVRIPAGPDDAAALDIGDEIFP